MERESIGLIVDDDGEFWSVLSLLLEARSNQYWSSKGSMPAGCEENACALNLNGICACECSATGNVYTVFYFIQYQGCILGQGHSPQLKADWSLEVPPLLSLTNPKHVIG